MTLQRTGWRWLAVVACVGLAATLVDARWARAVFAAAKAPPGTQASHELKPEVTVDVAKTRAPMSKYIYGQFIEHLGRCIYGGIWAEMLEDRKFYYEVGIKESPWKAIGDPASVTMNKDRPFVGAQTPDIRLAGGARGGIVQGDLAVVAGARYTGRIVIAGEPSSAPVRVTLVWGDAPSDRES